MRFVLIKLCSVFEIVTLLYNQKARLRSGSSFLSLKESDYHLSTE